MKSEGGAAHRQAQRAVPSSMGTAAAAIDNSMRLLYRERNYPKPNVSGGAIYSGILKNTVFFAFLSLEPSVKVLVQISVFY